MENFDLLKNKSGQELISVLKDGEDLLLRFSDETWLRIRHINFSEGELSIEENKG